MRIGRNTGLAQNSSFNVVVIPIMSVLKTDIFQWPCTNLSLTIVLGASCGVSGIVAPFQLI